MSDAFIVRRGAHSDVFAAIRVTYPAGSICTCANGKKMLKAKDTSGQALFLVPCADTWKVSYADESKADAKEISITSYGQLENVLFRVPPGYQEVEYIDCTGTQYITVPELPTANSELIWDVYYDPAAYTSGGKNGHTGVWGGPTTFGIQMNSDVSLKLRTFIGDTWAGRNYLDAPMTAAGWHTVTNSFFEGFVSVDDLKKDVTFGPLNFSSAAIAMGLGVIGAYYTSWSGANQKAKFFRCREFIWKESGAEHMHMIPCYRTADKVAGMYDLVNDVFYTNKGTGTFVVGGDVQ